MIYGPVNDNGTWKTRHNNELYTFYNEQDIHKVVKQEDWGGWDTSLECKKWILAERSLYFNQKALKLSWGGLSQLRKM